MELCCPLVGDMVALWAYVHSGREAEKASLPPKQRNSNLASVLEECHMDGPHQCLLGTLVQPSVSHMIT